MNESSRNQDGVCVTRLTEPGDVERLLSLLERIATELGWRHGGQLRTYQYVAQHLAVTVGGVLVGGLQMAVGETLAGLPCQNVWPEVASPETEGTGPFGHVTMLALCREWRGPGDLFRPLCVELWRACRAQGITELWLEATPPTLTVYRRLGFPLEVVGELRTHWGEDCYLCRMGVAEVAASLAEKAVRSRACQEMVRLAHPNTDPAGQ